MSREDMIEEIARHFGRIDDTDNTIQIGEIAYPTAQLAGAQLVYWFSAWAQEELYLTHNVRLKFSDGFIEPEQNIGHAVPDGFGDCWEVIRHIESGEYYPSDMGNAVDETLAVIVRVIEDRRSA